ncbi:PDCD10 and GCKIII kinases-associated protein 1 [Tamandua tetradactyla]|uniref:PDCD10 and GCKIII kinases-associated protein 1 n=1 Tax=Tamandua tetradactyla TaxID=48850 RepID=UPI004053D919
MGCRCCKMIQSYIFDPVQVPSPGYVNEVSSCKLDEDNAAKLKGQQSSEVLVHKNDLPNEGVKRTESRSRTASPQVPSWPPQGPDPQRDGAGLCTEGTGGTVDGIDTAATSQPTGNPRPHQGDKGPLGSTPNDSHLTQPFLDGEKQNLALLASEETLIFQNGDFRAPSREESHAVDIQDRTIQIPAPDYPQLWGSGVDSVAHGERDCLFQNHADDEPLERIHPRAGEHGWNMPFSMKRSWDSLNEAVTTEVLSVYFKEMGPAPAAPVVDTRNGREAARGSHGDQNGEMVDEDAAVAEALAALEAATAGEDVDEAY